MARLCTFVTTPILLLACAGTGQERPASQPQSAPKPQASAEQLTSYSVPQLEELCATQSAAACEELGDRVRFEKPKPAMGDTQASKENGAVRAAALYLQACEGGRPTACAQLAAMLQTGEGVGVDLEQAGNFYDRACKGKVKLACVSLGVLLASQGRRLKDARSLLEQGCNAKHAPACAYLATLYYEGSGGPQDIDRAVELLGRACDSNLMEACTMLGTVLERFLDDDAKAQQARRVFENSCNSGDPLGCAGLGRLLWSGAGGSKDEDRALSLWVRACDAGVGRACWDLANAHKQRKEDGAASRARSRACSLGIPEACTPSP